MKLPQFLKPKSKTKYLVSLDIGTEFVKALIGQVVTDSETNTGPVLEIIGVGRQRQRLSDMQSGAVTDIAGVVENCDRALQRAEQMSGVVATDAVIGIAGELVKGSSTTVKYRRARPRTQIDASELTSIVEQVQNRAFDVVRKQLVWETGYEEIEVKLVNAAITDVEIDGYRVTNPVSFQGRDVAVTVFNAFAPMVHLGALETVGSNLDLNVINIAAEPYAVAKSVGSDEAGEFSAIFIDIGGGTTDIALVNNGGVEGTRMFAIGGRSFTKRLSQQLGLSFEEAEQLKLDFSAGKLPAKKAKEVGEALQSDVAVWLSGVELSLSEFERVDHLPSKILLCGGGSGLPQIKAALTSADWTKKLPFARKPRVSFIAPSEVKRVVDKTGQLVSFADITPMGLANLGLDIVSQAATGENILNRLSRTLSA